MSKQDSGSTDGAMALLFGGILVALLSWIIWTKFHTPLNAILGKVRLGEIAVISLFTNRMDQVADWIRTTPASEVTFEQTKYLAAVVGDYVRWIGVPLAGLFWWLLYRSNRIEANKKRYTVRSLMRSQLGVWPQNTCIADIDLLKEDPRRGPWASAKTEYEFANAHKLLDPAEGLDREKCEEVFRKQLGPRWRGWQALPPHTKAIFAILIGRIASIDEKGDDLKREVDGYVLKLAREMPKNKPDYAWVVPLIKRTISNARVAPMLEQHAYVYTMIAGLLEAARVPGVLASCDFRWVKPIDRRLWYVMNCVGRRTTYAEVSGIFGHWLAERAAKRAIQRPYFDKAIDGLEEALRRFVGKPITHSET